MSAVATLFGLSESKLNRPNSGEIGLLMGVRYAGFHPVRCDSRDHLLLLQNRFGTTIEGTHPSVKETTQITSKCMQLRQATVMFVNGMEDPNSEKFYSIEGLGVSCIPKCGACRCGKCHPGGKDMSLKEEREYELISNNVQFNPERSRWMASYPWIINPSKLVKNRSIAFKILKSTERRLLKNPEHAALYSRQIQDMVNRNAARKVTQQELDNYSGAKYYIMHHGVFKPNSVSTPLRIVFNTSATFGNLSMNECLAKGPSLLNNLYGILLRFRIDPCAFIGDISKMYHSIDIPLHDQMVHLFLWRDLQLMEEPQTYAMTVVNMGDRPSATIAQVALRKTAEQELSNYPEAARIILKNSYMDDIPGGAKDDNARKKRMHEISTILANSGFIIKQWIYPGYQKRPSISEDQRQVQFLLGVKEGEDEFSEGVLGLRWNVESDTLCIVYNKSISKEAFTKRSVLSTVNSIYDPLGLLTPFTIRAKIIMRKMWAYEPKIDWDDSLPSSLVSEWMAIVNDMESINNLKFQRPVTPANVHGNPMLIIFSDGSNHAYGTAAYIRWQVSDGGISTCLLTSKSRVAPVKLIDTVRLELSGSTLSARLRCSILKELDCDFSKVIHLVDSEIVHAMINRESYGFNTFVGNRLGEIQRSTAVTDWGWIEGKLNIADVTTRGLSPVELGEDSEWQNGPAFLKLPVESWPVQWEVKKGIVLPEMKKASEVVLHTTQMVESLADRFNLDRFSRWKVLQYSTARILKLYKRFMSGGNRCSDISAADLFEAECFWIKEAQKDITMESIKKLGPVEENGIKLVGSRTERWNSCTWNRQKFIVLPSNHKISYLIASYIHSSGGHLGIDSTISKIRSKYWIIGIRRLVKNLIHNCIHCKIKLKEMVKQTMSPLPIERLKPSPAFNNVGLDYFGPFEAKGEVQQRVVRKCYGVIIVCLASGAVFLDLANDYSTEAFLLVLRRFASFRGWPQKIFSDKGTNLVGASNVLKEIVSNLTWSEIEKLGVAKGSEWVFSPADAHWYNGSAEALVKSAKRALTAAVGDSTNLLRMKFSEMLTVMYESAELINERPIGIHPSHPDEGYLCPNNLILGRSSNEVPQEIFQNVTTTKVRFLFVQQVVNAFWKRWVREVFPNLVLQKKWHTQSRNLMKGDVVLVQDINAIRGKWKRAVVQEPKISKDGKVRRVVISYRTASGMYVEVERAVQCLVLLVPVNE